MEKDPALAEVEDLIEQEELEDVDLSRRSSSQFPHHVSGVEKKTLYVLAAYWPRMFCAPSLIPLVGESSEHIRNALVLLSREGFLDVLPVPETLRTEDDPNFYKFRDKSFDSAIDYLWR